MSNQKMNFDELAMILAQNGYTVVPPGVPTAPETTAEEGARLYQEGRTFVEIADYVSNPLRLHDVKEAYLRERNRQEIKSVNITFVGGWGGGGFRYNGMYRNDFKKEYGFDAAPQPGTAVTLRMRGKTESFQAEVIKEIEREGSDFDHGHTSDWKSNDFLLKDPNLPVSPLVANEVSLMSLLNSGYDVSYETNRFRPWPYTSES